MLGISSLKAIDFFLVLILFFPKVIHRYLQARSTFTHQ
jgi:hypothetical protein